MVSIGSSFGGDASLRSFGAGLPTDGIGGSEAEQLQARLDAGGVLTPVESGTLARLMDGAADQAGPADTTSPAAGAGAAAPGKTVGDFTVTNATPQDLADLGQALSYLQSTNSAGAPLSPTAVDLLNALPAGATINLVHNGADQYDPNTGVIDWDPRSGLTVTSGQGTQSPALGLAHEIDHEVNGQANPTPTGDGYENSEEQRVIQGSETTIANDLHEPTRTDHGGDAVDMGSATDHSYYDKGNIPPVSSELPGLNGTPTDDGFGPASGADGSSDTSVADPGNPPPVSSDLPGIDGGDATGGSYDIGGGDTFDGGNFYGIGGDGGFVGGDYGGGSIGGGGDMFDMAELEAA